MEAAGPRRDPDFAGHAVAIDDDLAAVGEFDSSTPPAASSKSMIGSRWPPAPPRSVPEYRGQPALNSLSSIVCYHPALY
jgi:hypothetical protein